MLLAGCGSKTKKAVSSPEDAGGLSPFDSVEAPAAYHASLADVHLRYGFPKEAIAAFQEALTKENDQERQAGYRFQLGRAYLEAGETEKALREMEEATVASRKDDRKCDMWFEVGRIYVLNEQWGEAERAYRFVMSNSKLDWQRNAAATELNSIYAKTHAIDDLIASIEKAIEGNPHDDEARLRLAEIFATTKPNPQRAIEIYEAIRQEGKLRPELVERLASLYASQGEIVRAQALYEELVQTTEEGNKNRYRIALAQLFEKTDEVDRAEKLYRTVMERNPSDWEKEFARRCLYALCEKQGALGAIVATLEKRAAENPGDAEALAELSEIYSATNIAEDHQKAIGLNEHLLSLRPDDVAVLLRLADLYETTEQREKAIEAVKSAIAILPENRRPVCLERVIRLCTEAGAKEEAIKWIARLSSSEPENPGIHARASLLYLRNLQMEECLTEHERAVSLCTGAEQRDALRAELAEELFEVGQYARAELIYERLAGTSVSGPLKDLARQRLAALQSKEPRIR